MVVPTRTEPMSNSKPTTNGRRKPLTRAEIEAAWDEARDLDAEAAVIASCLLLGECKTRPQLTADDFTDAPHRTLWKAMTAMRRNRQPLNDMTLLSGQLRDMKRWGDERDGAENVSAWLIAHLFHLIPTASKRDDYAARVRELTARRAALARAETELKRGRGE